MGVHHAEEEAPFLVLQRLDTAFKLVKANGGSAGVDRKSIAAFEARLEENLSALKEELRKKR